MNTTGPIGTSSNRIQFADNTNTAQQNVIIGQSGWTYEPSSVYLDGLGSLTLANMQGGTVNSLIDVTARTNLTVAAGARVDSGTSTLSLGADLTADGSGDDGVGTLSIATCATVISTNTTAGAIVLRGADMDIDTSTNMAVVGGQRPVPSATLYGRMIEALTFDSSGNLYVANVMNNTVNKFAPGDIMPSATLTGRVLARRPGVRRQRQPLRGQQF